MDALSSLRQTIVKDRFPVWMLWSRTLQLVFAIVIFGLDAFVISEWNKNNFSNLFHPTIETTVGDTSFTPFTMFAVSHLSVCKMLAILGLFYGYLEFSETVSRLLSP